FDLLPNGHAELLAANGQEIERLQQQLAELVKERQVLQARYADSASRVQALENELAQFRWHGITQQQVVDALQQELEMVRRQAAAEIEKARSQTVQPVRPRVEGEPPSLEEVMQE